MECSASAQKVEEKCDYFQFSVYYPYRGCHCCESLENNTESNPHWNIYLTCNPNPADGTCYNKDYVATEEDLDEATGSG